jgi:hypothetical protein
MKNTALTTLPQINPGQLGTGAPRRRSEPMPLPVKALPVSSSNHQTAAKTVLPDHGFHHKSLKVETAFRYPSIPTSNGNPGSFNPELCGGFRVTSTLAQSI